MLVLSNDDSLPIPEYEHALGRWAALLAGVEQIAEDGANLGQLDDSD